MMGVREIRAAREWACTHVPTTVALELMAEECAELAQAALKQLRTIRDGNPTPVTPKEARAKLVEEGGDVLMCMVLLGLIKDDAADDNPKWLRMMGRMLPVYVGQKGHE